MEESFFKSVRRRAWVDTTSQLSLRDTGVLMVKFAQIAIFLFVAWLFDWNDLLADHIGDVWAGIVTLVALFPLVFALNLIVAPAKIYAEQRSEIAALKSEIEDKKQKQDAMDSLWNIRTRGIAIRNEEITEAQYPEWQDRFDVWHKDALDSAEKYSENLKNWLETLNEVGPTLGNLSMRGFVNDDHHLNVNIASEMLRRLDQVLKKDFL